MRFEFKNEEMTCTAEWQGPGEVMVDTADPARQQWFESYFQAEDSFMTGPVECGEMAMERRDESEAAFTRAAHALAAYSWQVRQGDARRHATHR